MNRLASGDAAPCSRQAGTTMRTEAARTTFEVLVRGELSADLVAEVGARGYRPCSGKTLILVEVIDQSHLHGVLGWLEDHNIEIERVNPV
jgi:hypothetical protein